jgi:hypothetical protein
MVLEATGSSPMLAVHGDLFKKLIASSMFSYYSNFFNKLFGLLFELIMHLIYPAEDDGF